MADVDDDLQRICRKALERSSPRTRELHRLLKELCDTLDALAQRGGEPFAALVTELTTELRKARDERLAHLDTFNIVFFGKTGAGKSSIIQALIGGTGDTASPLGDPDHTREVLPRSWGAFSVVDTPGFGGLTSDEQLRAELEKARRAAAAADVVVLCFNDENQRAAEFATVAGWIGAHQKVAVALLNIKNSRWRWEGDAAAPAADAWTRGHAAHMRAELGNIGLGRIPIVAVNAQAAMFARCRQDDYRGPMPGLRRTLLEAGREAVEERSHIGALIDLLTELIRQGGAQLRLGSTHRHVTALVEQAATRLRAEADEALGEARGHEVGIAENLTLMGRPGEGNNAYRALLDALAVLEGLRGEPFPTPADCQAAQFGRDVVAGRLGAMRRASEERARDHIETVMAERTAPAKGAFEKAVYDQEQINTCAKEALDDYAAFLNRSFDLVVRDVYREFQRHAEFDLDRVSPGKGKWVFRAAVGSSAFGFATSAAVVFAPYIAANLWNPFGWGAAGMVGLGVVAGILLDLLGSAGRKKAENQRIQALAAAHDEARESIAKFYVLFSEQLEAHFVSLRRAVLTDGLAGPVGDAVRQRRWARQCEDAITAIESFLRQITVPKYRLRSIVERAAAALTTDEEGADHMWLGARPRPGTQGTATASGPPTRSDVGAALTAFRAGFPAQVSRGATRHWLAQVRRSLADPELLAELRKLGERAEATIVFCGDYDSGKSSLIKRLTGADVPISAAPETARVNRYPLAPGVLALDTPGFQAAAGGMDRETAWEIATAALVVLAFTPGLVLCDPADLRQVLQGDEPAGVPGRAAHCLAVINRCDALGTDPEYDPDGFAAAVARRLERVAEDVPGVRHGVCVAAAPFGVIHPRSWDGVAELEAALHAMSGRLRADHRSVAVLAGGQMLLGERRVRLRREAAELGPRVEAARADVRVYGRLVDEAETLVRERGEDLRQRVSRLVDEKFAEALSAPTQQQRDALADSLQRLGEHPEFRRLLGEWSAQTARRAEAFSTHCAHQIEVAFETPPVRSAFPALAKLTGARALAGDGAKAAAIGADVLGKAGGLIGRAERFLAEAGRAAKVVRFLGPAIAIVGTGLSIKLLVDEVRQGAQSDETRRGALKKLHAQVDAWTEAALADDQIVAALGTLGRELVAAGAQRAAVLADLEARLVRATDLADRCTVLISHAAQLMEAK